LSGDEVERALVANAVESVSAGSNSCIEDVTAQIIVAAVFNPATISLWSPER